MESPQRLNGLSRLSNWLLTPGQRLAASLVLLLVAGGAMWRASTRGPALEQRLTRDGPLTGEVLSTISPATATVEEWSALPGVGPAMGKKIVAYREAWVAGHPGERVFATLNDLDPIPGIGPATLQRLAPYLRFEETAVPEP